MKTLVTLISVSACIATATTSASARITANRITANSTPPG